MIRSGSTRETGHFSLPPAQQLTFCTRMAGLEFQHCTATDGCQLVAMLLSKTAEERPSAREVLW